jgi:NADPH2:quinone reductase
MMANRVLITRTGGPEVLSYESFTAPVPGEGEVRILQEAIGLNFIDVYHRTGLYPVPSLPAVIGMEGAGTVEALGEGVNNLAVGDRVAYAGVLGGYADQRLIPAERLVKLPESISFDQAAAVMLQGMTVQYLIRRTFPVQAGQTVLWHSAAGGVGLLACQWLDHLGVRVIGTVGSEEKAELARTHGCHHTINYRSEDFVERVRELTGGEGVPVVYDSVGKDTFEGSLDCLSPLGMLVSFGNASGPVPPFEPGILAQKGSLFFTRPTLMTYIAKHDDLVATAGELFGVMESGAVKVEINQRYPLADVARAHSDLEARKTTGSTILTP